MPPAEPKLKVISPAAEIVVDFTVNPVIESSSTEGILNVCAIVWKSEDPIVLPLSKVNSI